MTILFLGIGVIMSFDVWSKKSLINYHSKFKIDRTIIISSFVKIDDSSLLAITIPRYSLPNQWNETLEMILERDGLFLQGIIKPIKSHQILAVNQNGFALQFIENPDKEVCVAALYQNPKSIPFIDIVKWPELYGLYVLLIR